MPRVGFYEEFPGPAWPVLYCPDWPVISPDGRAMHLKLSLPNLMAALNFMPHLGRNNSCNHGAGPLALSTLINQA